MRIAIISYSYWPIQAPRSYRWTAIAERWAESGHEVRVVAVHAGGSSSPEYRGGVVIHRIADWAGGRRKHSITGSAGNGIDPDARVNPPADSRVLRIVRSTWRNLYWPDHACLWIAPASKVVRKVIDGGIDAIVSVSNPFSAHCAVLTALLSETVVVPWLVDVGDPFSLAEGAHPNRPGRWLHIDRLLEQKILARASSICVTNGVYAEKLQAEFGVDVRKLAVIPPLVSVPKSISFPRRRGGKKRLVYAGSVHQSLRNPSLLVELFSSFVEASARDTWELHLVGRSQQCEAELRGLSGKLAGSLVLHGHVDRATAWELISGADCLVNIGNASSLQLPSKIVEYVSTGLPIINLRYVQRDPAARFLKDYGAALDLDCQQHDHSVVLGRFSSFLSDLPPRVSAADVERLLTPCQVGSVSAAYMSAIERAADLISPELRVLS